MRENKTGSKFPEDPSLKKIIENVVNHIEKDTPLEDKEKTSEKWLKLALAIEKILREK